MVSASWCGVLEKGIMDMGITRARDSDLSVYSVFLCAMRGGFLGQSVRTVETIGE